MKERQPHLYTCPTNVFVPPACLLLPQATGFNLRAQIRLKAVQIRVKFCLDSKTGNWWEFTLPLSRQSVCCYLVTTDQYQRTALGAMMYLLREPLRRAKKDRRDQWRSQVQDAAGLASWPAWAWTGEQRAPCCSPYSAHLSQNKSSLWYWPPFGISSCLKYTDLFFPLTIKVIYVHY